MHTPRLASEKELGHPWRLPTSDCALQNRPPAAVCAHVIPKSYTENEQSAVPGNATLQVR